MGSYAATPINQSVVRVTLLLRLGATPFGRYSLPPPSFTSAPSPETSSCALIMPRKSASTYMTIHDNE